MSCSEDKCEVSKDKHKDRSKIEYFCEAINSTEGRKRKRKSLLEEYISMSRSKMQRDTIFLLRAKLSTQSNRQLSVFVIELRLNQVFAVLGCQNQETRRQLMQPRLLPCCNAHTQIRKMTSFAFFFDSHILFRLCISCSDCLACGLAEIRDLWEIQVSYFS